jgi:hypothetical protein
MPIISTAAPNLYVWPTYIEQLSGGEFDSSGASWYLFVELSWDLGSLIPF